MILKKNEEQRILDGHSWVYANEVAAIEGQGKNGDEAHVYSAKGQFLGKGFINHASKILVRILSIKSDEALDEAFFEARIRRANDLRLSIGYSDCYRAVFAEADNLPALIVDKYADILSVQFLSLAMELQKDIIVKCLVKIFAPRGIYERSDVSVREKEGLKLVKGILYGDFDPRVEIVENGIRMQVDVENGQKTGYFLDQKENRYALRRYAKDKDVLDCFCNSGGFSLNCAHAGAKSVTALDISQAALDNLTINANLNGVNVDTVSCDVFDKLREYKREGRTFDLIILDPPAFCKSAAEAKDAVRGYKDINILALKLLNEGGILATCSCSHYVTMPLFETMLESAARDSRVKLRCLERRTQSPDHPSRIGSEETLYLKFYVLQTL
ncbi:MAG: class I SAM-dependent rRNA methyltransferase [Clostridia bacterium]|nr:class I SAM-dependent rRNA methyltransferase [Clostridia bacterium]